MQGGTKVRTNGFERPFHPLQVLSWVVFGTDVLVYIVSCLPLVETAGAKALVALSFAVSVVVLVVATVKATSCDPADPHVRCQDGDIPGDLETMPYCTICNVPVFPRSKHCRACNKCVSVFDHHCMWLNNCIGSANYRAFFVTVSAVAVMIGIVLSTCLYLLIDYFVNDNFPDRVNSIVIYRSFPEEFFLGLFILMVFVNAPLFLLDMQLVLLHIFLCSQDLTTYEYIMNKREITLSGVGGAKAKNLSHRIKTLPHCMDWIVFSRCGQKRRKPPQQAQQQTSVEGVPAKGGAPDAEAGRPVSADGMPLGADQKPVACVTASGAPPPPGSTAEAVDGTPDVTATSAGVPAAQVGKACSPSSKERDDILE